METSYGDRLKTVLQEEFSHTIDSTYLDHAGATLYSIRQLEDHMTDLASHLYGNPHSHTPSSQLSTDAIDEVRDLVLRHFNTDSTHYDVIFTSGCTAALKLLAESFPWSGTGAGHTSQAGGSRKIAKSVVGGSTSDTRQTGLCEKETCQTSITSHSHTEKVENVDLRSKSEAVDVVYLTGTEVFDPGNVLADDGSSIFCYLEDNHTSVVGMREVASCRGAKIVCVDPDKNIKQCTTRTSITPSTPQTPLPLHLFAYPAQSNFCGRKYPLTWSTDLPSGQVRVSGVDDLPGTWMVLLDAASYVATSPLDLTSNPAHFVALSFYKMFGYPTGLGALLVRSDSAHLLHKDYYGGGTVQATVSRTGLRVPRPRIHERLEDGTVSFLSIIALKYGFNTLNRIGGSMDCISKHTFNIARYVHDSLLGMRYASGGKVCQLYCETEFQNQSVQGPIVNFNLVKPDGQVIGYSVVERLAAVHNIHLRTGCFCNTGACMAYLRLSVDMVEHNIKAGHVCGDTMDIVNGHPTGSVRVSFGYMSTMEDARKFIHFITNTFVRPEDEKRVNMKVSSLVAAGFGKHTGGGSDGGSGHKEETSCDLPETGCAVGSALSGYPQIEVGDQVEAFTKGGGSQIVGTLSRLSLYPVKSCAAFSVHSWPLSNKGLLYDREWMVLSQHNSVLSQKQESRLCLVQSSIDVERQTMTLTAQGQGSVRLPLETETVHCASSAPGQVWLSPTVRVCGDRVQALDCGEDPSLWLSKVLNRQCRLAKQNPLHQRVSKSSNDVTRDPSSLSLANEAQYLFISDASVKRLLEDIGQSYMDMGQLSVDSLTERFRPNLVLSSVVSPYAEEGWERLRIGKAHFKVVGGCSRCQMICVDQATGIRSPESLRTLTSLRGSKALFGIYLTLEDSPNVT